MKPYLFCFLFLALFSIACNSTDPLPLDPHAESVIRIERSLFDCGAYTSTQLADVNDNRSFSEMVQYGSYFLYGGLTHLQVREGFDGAVVQEEEFSQPIRLHEFQGRLFVYGTDGIYEWLNSGSLVMRSAKGARYLITTLDGTLLGVPDSASQTIVIIDPADFSQTPYIQSYDTELCVTLEQLHIGPQGDIWAVNCNGDLLRFRDGTFVSRASAAESSSIQPSTFWGESSISPEPEKVEFLNYEGRLIVVTKAGMSFYEILEYRGGTWESILRLNNAEEDAQLSEKAISMMTGDVLDAAIEGKFLYVGTSQGIHEIDLTNGVEQSVEDIVYFRDPDLTSNSVHQFYQGTDGNWYVLDTQKLAVNLGCD